MAKVGGSNKKTLGSVRAKAGLPAKAGRRRPNALVSERDRNGNRNWVAAANQNVKHSKPCYNIADKPSHDIYDATADRLNARRENLSFLRSTKNLHLIGKAEEMLRHLAGSVHKANPFWFNKTLKDFRMGWISHSEIMSGKVA